MTLEEKQQRWHAFRMNLRAADVILVHDKRGFLQKFIRERTGGYWNHTALVLESWDRLPFGGPLIVEAADDGIEIHRLKKYTDNLHQYDIGIMRYPGLTEQQKKDVVTAFILNNIDVPYDYGRLWGLIFKPWAKALVSKATYYRWAQFFIKEQNFICSTFVHKAFHLLHEKHVDDSSLEDRYRHIRVESMYSPKDVADDPIFEWVFNEIH